MKQLVLSVSSAVAIAMLVACASTQDDAAQNASSASSENGEAARTPAARTGSRVGATRTGGRVATNNGDASAPVVSTGDAGPAAPTSCYAAQGDCDPTDANGCTKGQTCDINGSTDSFMCFDPPNDAHLGDACDNANGPFCAQGLACNAGTCATYCCDDSVCAAGTTCQETGLVGAISVKLCL